MVFTAALSLISIAVLWLGVLGTRHWLARIANGSAVVTVLATGYFFVCDLPFITATDRETTQRLFAALLEPHPQLGMFFWSGVLAICAVAAIVIARLSLGTRNEKTAS